MMMLDVRAVSHRYGQKQVLDGVTFSVKKGELFGILGPNGSGKTTLLKLISKELPLASGEIVMSGRLLSELSAKQWAQLAAVLPQAVETAYGYTVKETVALGRYAHQHGLFPTWTAEDETVVQEVIAAVGLADKIDEPLERLSGGERQRAYLARALAQEPQLLLLDEPTNHMDISGQVRLLDQLAQSARARGLTVVAVFHDMSIASLYCDRVLVLKEGKTAALGAPADVMTPRLLNDVFAAPVVRQAHPVAAKPMFSFVPQQQRKKAPLIGGLHPSFLDDAVVLVAHKPLRVLSSALVGSGFQWVTHFVNRHVGLDYDNPYADEDMRRYLEQHGFSVAQTIGMMTAVDVHDVVWRWEDKEAFSVAVMVTAGVGNAVDAARAWQHQPLAAKPGTINMVIIIDGTLTEAAFVQAVMTATEAKAKALADHRVYDPETGTVATGTSTDSLAVAATQTGRTFAYAGTATELGRELGRLVYEATIEALDRYERRRGRR
ncbi:MULTISPECIES: adenosylcobinamide amidohydrolase [Geobacillus]|jgi:iron complex transport system ATP-binding protein|uniref:Iron(III) dicitrate transport system permease n=4 Tax=Geobacillus thermodenitrificans TaxID=33940 RepID=A4IQE2_GEOTN|nr:MULTISPECIES: adenosylcobinamide amidohydrolase [Geobacillus]OJF17646.1 MAG: ABC transporter ATP-binding protein [Bacillaceae bacterium G1]ABO67546.1 Iron(III) dicitrate transport system permease [Geobacillus thermodenitrificans NG80-2]ARA99301.1 ABC transporter ATP-binding protein [Geobacillus thermodenitrificans]MED0662351.1 ABC transporter ATP-binding protein [Geobacillus thermodenitrificans]MED3717110.1 adenosylcobinamide amidohydrolase [Geobacillus thermodenitrificans]